MLFKVLDVKGCILINQLKINFLYDILSRLIGASYNIECKK